MDNYATLLEEVKINLRHVKTGYIRPLNEAEVDFHESREDPSCPFFFWNSTYAASHGFTGPDALDNRVILHPPNSTAGLSSPKEVYYGVVPQGKEEQSAGKYAEAVEYMTGHNIWRWILYHVLEVDQLVTPGQPWFYNPLARIFPRDYEDPAYVARAKALAAGGAVWKHYVATGEVLPSPLPQPAPAPAQPQNQAAPPPQPAPAPVPAPASAQPQNQAVPAPPPKTPTPPPNAPTTSMDNSLLTPPSNQQQTPRAQPPQQSGSIILDTLDDMETISPGHTPPPNAAAIKKGKKRAPSFTSDSSVSSKRTRPENPDSDEEDDAMVHGPNDWRMLNSRLQGNNMDAITEWERQKEIEKMLEQVSCI